MNSSSEQKCIEKAYEARVISAQNRLEDLRKNGISFDSPLSGFSGSIEWKEERKERIKQILFIPIALMLVAFMVLSVPVVYLLHLWEAHNKNKSIKNEITANCQNITNIEVPKIKTLELLWHLHGLNEYQYDSAEKIELLKIWLEILYGEENTKSLNINQRVKTISGRHVKANIPYYQGKEGAAHYHFVSPVDALIRELSDELPEYEQMA